MIGRCGRCSYITRLEEYTNLGITEKLCSACASIPYSLADEADNLAYLTNAIVDALDIRDKFENVLKQQEKLDRDL